MTTGKLRATLSLPTGYEAELVATSLRASGWQNLSYNDMTDEITGEKKKSERKSGLTFNFDYRCHCFWWREGDASILKIEVTDEERNSSKRDCQKLAHEIISGVESRSHLVAQRVEDTPVKTTYGADRFALEQDLKSAGYTTGEVKGNGLLIAPHRTGERIVIPEEEACRHAIVCGPTGCGKTSSIFIPNLIEKLDVSALVTEATSGTEPPDLYFKTSGHRKAHGHKIYYFNPDDMASVRINPVDYVTTLARAQEMAQLIMKNTSQKFKSNGESKFWQDAETHLFTALLMHVSAEKGNLAQIRALLREGPQKLGDVIERGAFLQARQEYQAYLNVSTESIRNGVMCGLMQRLNNWINPRVVALTSHSDVDLSNLPNELFTFYLAVPSDKDGLKPVAALVLNYILNALKEAKKETCKHKVALVLDEFTNFGYLPSLPSAMGIIRHQEIPVILGCQDYSQIKIEYGEDDTKKIFNNAATRVIFRTTDLPTAKSISESLGEETVVERKLNTGCQVVEKESGRPLMRPSEVMSLDKKISIVFTPSSPPIKVTRYSWEDYKEQTSVTADSREPIEVDEQLIRTCSAVEAKEPWQAEFENNFEQEQLMAKSNTDSESPTSKKGNATKSTGTESVDTAKSEKDFDLPI